MSTVGGGLAKTSKERHKQRKAQSKVLLSQSQEEPEKKKTKKFDFVMVKTGSNWFQLVCVRSFFPSSMCFMCFGVVCEWCQHWLKNRVAPLLLLHLQVRPALPTPPGSFFGTSPPVMLHNPPREREKEDSSQNTKVSPPFPNHSH